MGQLAIVNAPSSFTIIWSMIKPWLSKETVEKVDILGHDYKDQLLKLIDADCLPSTLGGMCECKEAGGCRLSGIGPWLDGRVGWGPNAKTNPLDKLDNQDVTASKEDTKVDIRDIVLTHNGSALVEPMANGKIHKIQIANGENEPQVSSSLERVEADENSEDRDALGGQESQG